MNQDSISNSINPAATIDLARYRRCMWAELGFLILSIASIFPLDLERLPVGAIVNIAFDWMAMFSLIIMLNNCIQGLKTQSTRSFLNLTVSIFFIVLFEAWSWAVDGLPSLRAVNYLSNIGSNTVILVSASNYVTFICDSLDIHTPRIQPLCRSVRVVMVFGIAAELLNYPFGYFYSVNEAGVYHSHPVGVVLGYLPFLYMLGCSCVLVLRIQLPHHKKLNYMVYSIAPLLIAIWYTLTGRPPTFYLAPFLSLLIVYGNIYVQQGEETERFRLESAQKDAELAWQRNQLTRSQIKPHFIFNCLGSIEQLCRIDAEEARTALHYFSKYLRTNMDSLSEQSLIPLTRSWSTSATISGWRRCGLTMIWSSPS